MATSDLTCSKCCESYAVSFAEDFLDGKCLPCRSVEEYEAFHEREIAALREFNRRNGTNLSWEAFLDFCFDHELKYVLEFFLTDDILLESMQWGQSLRNEAALERDHRQQPELTFDEFPF